MVLKRRENALPDASYESRRPASCNRHKKTHKLETDLVRLIKRTIRFIHVETWFRCLVIAGMIGDVLLLKTHLQKESITSRFEKRDSFYLHRNLRESYSFSPKPLVVHVEPEDFSVKVLPVTFEILPRVSRQASWEVNKVYRHHWKRGDRDSECEAMADWQDALHETCYMIHEIDLSEFNVPTTPPLEKLHMVGSGYFRDVWMFRDFDNTKRALKTLHYEEIENVRKAEDHRMEAVILDRTQSSKHVANMYGYCRNTAIFDFADGGDLKQFFLYGDNELPDEHERLQIARDVATALADAHNVDERGRATVAHTDIKPNNFVFVDGRYQLNDFNRAVTISWNPKKNEACGFSFGSPGKWRSPEEYLERKDLSEKIDVWSLGNVLFIILTGKRPWGSKTSDDVIPLVKDGFRPNVKDAEILKSDHVFHKTMLRALDMCFIVDPKERASARQVADLLQQALQSVELH